MLNDKIKPAAIVVGAAFAASAAMAALADSESGLFAAEELEPQYDLLADAHGGEGSCGDDDGDEEGSCGDKDDAEEGSCGEGSCGGDDGGDSE